jgi:TubC N-terminal docking domain
LRLTPVQALGVLEKAGISVVVSGEDLVARPTALVTDDVREFIKDYKTDLLAHLCDDGLGLIAAWSKAEFGYVSLHDPTTGEWHDVATKNAPGWAKWECRKRKELYKAGDARASRLSSKQMSEIWEDEHPDLEEEGIIEDHQIEEDYE